MPDRRLPAGLRGQRPVESRTGNDEPGFAPHTCYRCEGDDQWVAIAVGNDDEWKAFVDVLGDPAWAQDPRSRMRRVGAPTWRTSTITLANGRRPHPAEVTTLLQAAGVAASPAFRAPELLADPHVVSRDLIATVRGPTRDWKLVRLGGRFRVTPLQLDRVGPDMGEPPRPRSSPGCSAWTTTNWPSLRRRRLHLTL